jgi:hypothetical protein
LEQPLLDDERVGWRADAFPDRLRRGGAQEVSFAVADPVLSEVVERSNR